MATNTAILHCHVALASAAQAFTAPNNVEARNDVDPQFKVGALYRDAQSGKTYIYVRFDNGAAVAAVAGQLCYVNSAATWDPAAGLAEVTSDVSGSPGAGTTGLTPVVGVFTYAVTDRYYTFAQCGGLRTDVLSASVTAGSGMIGGTTDGRAEIYAATEANFPFATALTASA